MSSTSSSEAGQVLGHYRLERKVAKGGMGEIWLAVDLRTDQTVAIKRMLLSAVGELSERHRVRMMREARALEQLRHEHIVRYLETGFDDEGQPYLVLEWLHGDDLEHRHRRTPLDLAQVLEVAAQSLAGLAVCHEQGIIHRDIKPGNLFLVEGEQLTLKLVDFGLALLGNEISRLTRAGQIIGTLYYLSPEQARGERGVDHRSDLYAMGVVLYELVTGKLPFWSDRPAAVLLKIVSETPPRPRILRPDLPAWLEQVILRAMQRDPAARFASAEEMLAALRPTSHERVDSVAPVSVPDAQVAQMETLPPTISTETREYRLVTLLCVLPTSTEVELTPVVTEAVGAVRGVVYSLLGGQTVGIYGLDRTVGDEALRAVQAGLAVREAAGERARLLAATVHLAVGNGLQLDGKELDQATELLGTLPPGELVLDQPTLELLGGKVETRAVGAHTAAAHQLTEVPVRRRVLGVETPTVGRELELASIRAARQRAEDEEEPEALLVLGQPGIGKSRLYDDVVPGVVEASVLCLEGRARSSQSQTPYGLLADAFTRAAGIHVGQAPQAQREALEALVLQHAPDKAGREALLFIGEAMGLDFEETDKLRAARAEPKLMRTRTAWAFETFLRAVGQRGLVSLCLEDLHWADDESLGLCEHLIDRLERTSLFVLGTARPELLERRPDFLEQVDASRVELRPLKRRPLRKLLGALLGEGLGRELEQVIASWSDGNPFFAEELVSWMVTRNILVRQEGGWRLAREPQAAELPAGIEGAIQGRLDRLALDPKELLKAASVFGEVFWQDGCEVLGFADAALQLRELEAAQFVIRRPESRIPETSEWSFRHALLQQVAYGMLPEERRLPLHLKVARWLEQVGERDAALLAHHFELGGARARASGYHAQAGERALAEGHPERAEACYQAALESAGDEEDSVAEGPRAAWTLKLARAHFVAGHHEDASAVLASLESADHGEGPRRASEAAFLRGQILMWKGDYDQAAAVLRAAGDAARDDDELAFEIWRVLFWIFWGQGKYQEAGRVAEALYSEALESGRPEHLSPAKLAFAYYNVVQGDLSASVELSKEAVAHARQISHPYGEIDSLTLLGSAQELVGQYDEAMQTLEAGHALTRQMKLPIHQAIIEACMGRVCLIQNRAGDALTHYRTAREQAEQHGDYRTTAAALAGEARALCRRSLGQDMSEAAAAVQRAVELAVDRAPPVVAEARLALAELAFVARRTGEALEEILAAVELLDRLGGQEQCEIEILLVAHDVLRLAEREDEALELLRRARHTLRQRARRITDEGVLESFMQRVPHNRQVEALWRASREDLTRPD